MSTLKKRILTFLLLVSLVIAGAAAAFISFQGPALVHVFTGASARFMCSAVFAAHRDETWVRKQEYGRTTTPGKYLGLVDLRVDYEAKTVSAALFGFGTHKAVFRDGIGCTSTNGTSLAQLMSQGSGGRSDLAPPDPTAQWPEGSATNIGPPPQGIDAGKLRSAVRTAFAEPDPDQPRNTRAVLVVHRGHIIAERYGEGFSHSTGHLSNSIAKTFISALVGILVREGKLDVNARAPVAEWSDPNDPRHAITLDHLLRMQSGLVFLETYDRVRSDLTLMYANGDLAGFAAAKPLEAEPGTKWKYSTGTSNIIGRIVFENAGATYPERFSFPRRELFEPLGMRTAVLEVDGKGSFIGGSSVYASARDYARFGLLYLRNGVWNGKRVLPEGWVEYTLTPTANAPAETPYGVQVWLNNDRKSSILHWPEMPPDTFIMRGHQGQYVVVIPSFDMVIVRLGLTEHGNWSITRLVRDVLDATGL